MEEQANTPPDEQLEAAAEAAPKKKKKKKPKVPRQAMPEQSARRRARNFEEVPYGYPPETAVIEAARCIQCKKPLCIAGCPVNIDIPAFIKQIADGDFEGAAVKLLEQTALPAVCGRVCPQESQCEAKCILGKKQDPVAIGRLERFAADYVREHGGVPAPVMEAPTGKKIAIIGAGPAGITVAGDLARLGHKVVMYEALHLTGGVLMYGIPQFRLPKEIVQYEVDALKNMGVEIHTDYVIGKSETVDQLLEEKGFDAVFIGSGAGLPMFMRVPGENAIGVFSANEFLTRINLMKCYDFPRHATSPIRAEHVITVGGGNVAMDSARCALRMGSKSTVVYRRAREQMPARDEEIHHAEEEGVTFNLLTNPTKIVTDENNKMIGMEVIKMELGEPDDSGRRRPVPMEGSEYFIEADCCVVSIGNSPNPLIPQTSPDLETTRWGTLVADDATMLTSKDGVFAGGDVVSGAATVISAMGQAKIAAQAIHRYVMGLPLVDPETEPEEKKKEEAAAAE